MCICCDGLWLATFCSDLNCMRSSGKRTAQMWNISPIGHNHRTFHWQMMVFFVHTSQKSIVCNHEEGAHFLKKCPNIQEKCVHSCRVKLGHNRFCLGCITKTLFHWAGRLTDRKLMIKLHHRHRTTFPETMLVAFINPNPSFLSIPNFHLQTTSSSWHQRTKSIGLSDDDSTFHITHKTVKCHLPSSFASSIWSIGTSVFSS
mgnify:CR=1 FL=1